MAELDAFLALAIKAGAEILDVYAGDFAVMHKADSSPVTQADLRAEAVILQGLAALCPHIPVVAEERTAQGLVPDTPGSFFLVDPLDGSREFVARNGEFTVNIALIEDGFPAWGIVHAPVLGRIWWGAGQGAWRADIRNGIPANREAIAVARTNGAARVVGSRSHPDPRLLAYCEGLGIADFVEAGSSLKFCMLAQGDADLYPRFNCTMEWDTAAGDAVLRAAGGSVRTHEGALLAYGKRGRAGEADFANPPFIASTEPAF